MYGDFCIPTVLLGTVTPSLVKYSVDSLDDSGKRSERWEHSTIGSIIGTLSNIADFVTIPAVGISITFLIFAGILIALAAVYFWAATGDRRRWQYRQLFSYSAVDLAYSILLHSGRMT